MSDAHDVEAPEDLSNPADVKRRTRRLKLEESERGKMVKALMSLPQGRKWVFELLSKCHVFQTSFSANALIMANNEGERNIGLWVYADLTAYAWTEYELMLKECNDAVQK